jgi:uncharacterized protein (DUF302 family)
MQENLSPAPFPRLVTSERITVSTDLPFERLVRRFEEELGVWDLEAARDVIPQGWAVLSKRINDMRGPHGLMVVATTDQGEIASVAGNPIRCILYAVGNPVIATEVLGIDIRACFLVPFRVALFDDVSGEHAQMVYDRPSTLLAQLNQPKLAEIGGSLDQKTNTVALALMAANA